MPSNHNRDKPWDTGDVDKWKASGSLYLVFHHANH
jgi:hypothetical protein